MSSPAGGQDFHLASGGEAALTDDGVALSTNDSGRPTVQPFPRRVRPPQSVSVSEGAGRAPALVASETFRWVRRSVAVAVPILALNTIFTAFADNMPAFHHVAALVAAPAFVAAWTIELSGVRWPRLVLIAAVVVPNLWLTLIGHTETNLLFLPLLVGWVACTGTRAEGRIALVLALGTISVGQIFVAPKRWMVERTFAWLVHHRRLRVDYEATIPASTALIHIAMLHLTLRRRWSTSGSCAPPFVGPESTLCGWKGMGNPLGVEHRSASCQMPGGYTPVTLAAMTHILSSHPTIASPLSRFAAGARTAGRFVLHFGEMCLAMQVGMLIFMPLASLIPTALQQIAMALFMAAPMVAWMRIRGHGWRHGFEMALAMLVPWAVLLGAANVLPMLAQAAGPAMYLGMLGFMLVRRDHHGHGGAHQHSAVRHHRRFRFRPVLLAIAYFAAGVLVPSAVGIFTIGSKWTAQDEPVLAPSLAAALPALPVPDPRKKIAVVLSSAYGAEITDTLPNFEILARSGVFNVYSVAPERTVLPLVSETLRPTSLDFIPHFSYAEYESQIGRDPDLIVIPGMPGYTPRRDAAMVDWIRAHAGPNTTVLGICIGGIVLADTGLLDGHTATTNAGVFADLASKHPDTTWVPNVRYLDDGTMVESTTLTSGIDATLHIVDRFAGRATALDVARQIGYANTGYLDDPRWAWPSEQWPTTAPLDDRFGLIFATGAFRGQQLLGVPLFDGVSEAGVAGLLDPNFGSLNSRPFVMAPERTVVRSLNGFQFVPRYDFGTVPSLDRVLVPAGPDSEAKRQVVAAWSADRAHRPVEDIFRNVGNGETAYEATFEDLARMQGSSFARADASILFYVIDPTRLQGADWSVQDVLGPLLLSLLGAAAVYGATHLRISRRARLEPIPQPA